MSAAPADPAHLTPIVINWPTREAPGFWDWTQYRDTDRSRVTKIVLGPSPKGQYDSGKAEPLRLEPEEVNTLLRELVTFPNLTHLYLWNLGGLRVLPDLGLPLRCLDLRGCTDLERIEGLPGTLELLDLGGCERLSDLEAGALPSLTSLHMDGCVALEESEWLALVRSWRKMPSPLEVLDLSRNPWVRNLKGVPGERLRKVVMRGCAALEDVSGVEGWTALDHLDLSECPKLPSLPSLGNGVRHVYLAGSEQLKRFADQDIGLYDRGDGSRRNVAPLLHSRRKFGSKLVAAPHAKLLLLGDGRVGKTTLAKRLQWESLDVAGRKAQPKLKPDPKEDPTHRIRAWTWQAPLTVTSERWEDLEKRAASRKIVLPQVRANQLKGTVRIWDFGGQEIYHNTHRLFAAEGSVFLIVWNDQDVPQSLLDNPPAGVDRDTWKEWNKRRSLDYWLSYVKSLPVSGSQRRPSVALVRTCCPLKQARSGWQDRVRDLKDWTDLQCFEIDSLDDDCGKDPRFRSLVEWIAEKCGAEADRIGILQPELFADIGDEVEKLLGENSRLRDASRPPIHLLEDWGTWSSRLERLHAVRTSGAGQTLTAQDINAITGYLHDAGRVFRVEAGGARSVLVDQDWATEKIYEMLLPGGRLYRVFLQNGGWITRADLELAAEWKSLPDDFCRERLLGYMEQCRILVEVVSKEDSAIRDTIYVANEKWLLPEDQKVLPKLTEAIDVMRKRPDIGCREKFRIEQVTLTEFQFRQWMAHLGRSMGERGNWYRNGLFALSEPDPETADWLMHVHWKPDPKDEFHGKVDVLFLGTKLGLERRSQDFERLLVGPGSPLEGLTGASWGTLEDSELARAGAHPFPGQSAVVGVSNSGGDAALAECLVAELKARQIPVEWYKDPACRADEYELLMPFLRKLTRTRCMVLLLSDTYLRQDPLGGWYCPWELADAICRHADKSRVAEDTFVVYVPDGGVRSSDALPRTTTLLSALGTYYLNEYKGKPNEQLLNYQHYHELGIHFQRAVGGGAVGQFFQRFGSPGAYDRVGKRDGQWDVKQLADDIEARVRSGRRGEPLE